MEISNFDERIDVIEDRLKRDGIDCSSIGSTFVSFEIESQSEPVMPGDPPNKTGLFKKYTVLLSIVLLAICMMIVNLVVWPYWLTDEVTISKVVDDDFHHLGDNVYNPEYFAHVVGDKIRNLEPEGTSYSTFFSLNELREEAGVTDDVSVEQLEVYVTINHVKPRQTAPVILSLNNNFQGFINDEVEREEFKRTEVVLELSVTDLVEGDNLLMIEVGRDIDEGDYEDMEFNDLRLKAYFDSRKVKYPTFIGVIVVEIVLMGIIIKVLW
jgi:hypothetical protein